MRCPNSGIVASERYEDNKGFLHRLNGPALIERDRISGIETLRLYFVHNAPHRIGGDPAVEEFDPHSGAPIWRAWHENGEYARADGLPHVERIDPETGKVIEAQFRIANDSKRGYSLHNETGPARIIYDRITGEQISAEYLHFGRKRSGPCEPKSQP